MNAYFPPKPISPRDSHSVTFQIWIKGVGIVNTTTGTTPFLLPSTKSTTPMAANSQNQVLKPHVAASKMTIIMIINKREKEEMNERGWDPHTWATKLSNTPFFSSPFPSSSPHSVAGLLVQPSQTQPETAATNIKKKKKKQREDKRKRRERMENGKRIKNHIPESLSPLFLLNAFGLHL